MVFCPLWGSGCRCSRVLKVRVGGDCLAKGRQGRLMLRSVGGGDRQCGLSPRALEGQVPSTQCTPGLCRFHLPSHQACTQLGISLSVLKRVCRKQGIPRYAAPRCPRARLNMLCKATQERGRTGRGMLQPCLRLLHAVALGPLPLGFH